MFFAMAHSVCTGSPSKVRAQVLGSQGFPQIAQDRLNGEMKGGSDIEPGHDTFRHAFELVKIGQSRVLTVAAVRMAKKSPSLTMSAVSSSFRAHYSMHSEKSAISLSWVVCAFQLGLASNRW